MTSGQENDLQESWNGILDCIDYSGNSQVVAFVGTSKAGKTTLIKFLLGNPLMAKDRLPDETHIVCAIYIPQPANGSDQSETFIPRPYTNLPGTTWAVWDFPGFGDNQGTHQEIANAGAYTAVLEPYKLVRFVIVVSIDDIKSKNPMTFFKLLNDIYLICPNVADSVCIVATKGRKGMALKHLKKVAFKTFPGTSESDKVVINNAKSVLGRVQLNNIIDLKVKKTGSTSEMKCKLQKMDKIINIIWGLEGSEVSCVRLFLSDLAKKEIIMLYTVIYKAMQKEINDTCMLLEKDFKNENKNIREHSGTNMKKKTNLNVAKEKVINLRAKTNSLEEFIFEAKKMGIRIEVLEETAKKFAFTEKFQNRYHNTEGRQLRGEEEFLTRIKILLIEAVVEFSKH